LDNHIYDRDICDEHYPQEALDSIHNKSFF
jgi:hypothetical protein